MFHWSTEQTQHFVRCFCFCSVTQCEQRGKAVSWKVAAGTGCGSCYVTGLFHFSVEPHINHWGPTSQQQLQLSKTSEWKHIVLCRFKMCSSNQSQSASTALWSVRFVQVGLTAGWHLNIWIHDKFSYNRALLRSALCVLHIYNNTEHTQSQMRVTDKSERGVLVFHSLFLSVVHYY